MLCFILSKLLGSRDEKSLHVLNWRGSRHQKFLLFNVAYTSWSLITRRALMLGVWVDLCHGRRGRIIS